MISIFFKKSIKNKSFSITFIIFTILSGAFIGFPLMVSLSNGFTVSMINKVMWIVSFCVYMVVLLILLLILKTIIFDNDLNFLIKNEIQYRVKKIVIYFTRYLVLITFSFVYITFILICYFIYTSIFVKGNMNYSVFISGTIGYVAFLYLFAFGTISILFLTTFIKNSGLKFSLPFLILLSFLTMTIYGQFVNVPNVSVYNPIPGTKDFQGFVAMEKQFLNYEKFEKSDFSSLYQKNFDSNISKVKEAIDNFNLPVASDPNFSIYNVFVRNHFFNGQPDEINYNKNHRTISDVYHDLSNSSTDQNLKDFFNCLSKIYSNFELNNMFNIYLLQSNSVNNNYYGFLNSQTYIDKEYNKSKPDKYNMSVDEFLALRFINLANQYSQPIKNIYVNNFKSEYSSFKSELRTIGYAFFWVQPAYLLSGTNSNISNDMDRSLVYMGSAPMEKLLNFSFSGNDKDGYTIINQIKEQTYSYLLLVTEYMLVIILMNCVAYFLFNKKIVE